MKITSAFAFALILGQASVTYAVDPAPGAACAVNNARTFSGGVELGGIGHWLVCVAGTWQASYTSTAAGLVAVGTTGVESGVRMEVGGGLRLSPGASGNAGFLQLAELLGNGTHSVSLRAPDNIASNFSITLPTTSGSAGWSLVNVGNGTLGWTTGGAPSFPLLANPQGTAGAPAYSFSTTTNTGMYSTGVGTLAFSTAGTNALTITNLGRIGIGTTNPSQTLDVNSDANVSGILFFGGDCNAGCVHSGGIDAGVDLTLTSHNSGDIILRTDGNNRMRILASNGNTGIGTASPTARLQVQGDIKWAGAGSVGIYAPTAGNYTMRWPNHPGALGQALITSGTGGILSWGTPVATPSFPLLANPQGTAGAPAYSFSTTTNTGMYSTGVGTLALSTAGTNALTITNLGRIGMGTTNPVSRLHVNGVLTLQEPGESAQAEIFNLSYGVGNGWLVFSAGGTNGRIAEFHDGANTIFDVSNSGGTSTFNYDLSVAGQAGIGTDSPTARLQVQGDIKWAGAGSVGIYAPTAGNYTMRWPNHPGALGQALITSGTGGILSWGTPVATPSFPLLANPQGTAGAPAYSFSNTTNTGMYSTGVGTLAFSTAGTNAVTITNLGRVGIGVATPAVALDVNGDINVSYNNFLRFKNSAGDTTIRVDVGTFDIYHGGGDVLTIAATSGSNPVRLDHWGSGDIDLRVPSGGLRVVNNGSVGIGTTTPTAKLQVQGDIKWAGAGSVGIYAPTAGNYTLRWPNHAGAAGQALLTSGTGGILSWGAPVAATSFPLLANPQGTVAAPAYSFSTTTNTGMYSTGVGTLAFSTAGTNAITVNNLGNVGIGTATPNSKMSIAGIPAASTTSSLVTIGQPWANAHSNGTYLGVNGNNSFTGSLLDLKQNDSSVFSVWANARARLGITAYGMIGGNFTWGVTGGSGHNFNGSYYGVTAAADYWNTVGVWQGYLDSTNLGVIGSYSGATASQLGFMTANGSGTQVEHMRITSGGSVGIGTTAPTSAFSVAGLQTANADFFLDNPNVGDGNDGQRLTVHRRAAEGNDSIAIWTDQYRVNNIHSTGILDLRASNVVRLSSTWAGTYTASTSGSYGPGVAGFESYGSWGPTNSGTNMSLVAVNSSGTTQRGFVGAFSNASGYSPTIFFGQQTGANSYQERMRISAAGNVGIGTTSPGISTSGTGRNYLTITGSTGAGVLEIATGEADADGVLAGIFGFTDPNNTGDADKKIAGIWSNYSGATDNRRGGNMVFGTRVNNALGPSERMRIDANGLVGIGVTNPSHILHISAQGRSTDAAWATTSDIRLKDIEGDYSHGLNEILGLNTVKFRYKKDNPLGLPSDKTRVGVIAQELQAVIPEAVEQTEDGYLIVNSDPIHWAVINAIQDVYHRLKAAIADISILKANDAVQDREIASVKAENAELRARAVKAEQESAAIKAYLCGKDPAAPICK